MFYQWIVGSRDITVNHCQPRLVLLPQVVVHCLALCLVETLIRTAGNTAGVVILCSQVPPSLQSLPLVRPATWHPRKPISVTSPRPEQPSNQPHLHTGTEMKSQQMRPRRPHQANTLRQNCPRMGQCLSFHHQPTQNLVHQQNDLMQILSPEVEVTNVYLTTNPPTAFQEERIRAGFQVQHAEAFVYFVLPILSSSAEPARGTPQSRGTSSLQVSLRTSHL